MESLTEAQLSRDALVLTEVRYPPKLQRAAWCVHFFPSLTAGPSCSCAASD